MKCKNTSSSRKTLGVAPLCNTDRTCFLLYRLRAVAASAYDDIKEQTATGLQHVMETRTVVEIGITLSSSCVVIPRDGVFRGYVASYSQLVVRLAYSLPVIRSVCSLLLVWSTTERKVEATRKCVDSKLTCWSASWFPWNFAVVICTGEEQISLLKCGWVIEPRTHECDGGVFS